jgi:hypothetical protein
VKLVIWSGDNCLHCFVKNVFEKKSIKFNLNRPSFMNVMVKTLLVFSCPAAYVTKKFSYVTFKRPMTVTVVA